ncbi:DUF397 domain-containing protein [Streptomyces bauhiniae]|uniref:DUF397 domain-containing protein n=1 Tax=Streptomyces bauhiniae TaxID=2340725 RepID=UPI003690BC48
MSTTDESAWVKSSYSDAEGGNCVEVAVRPGAIHIRDSKDTRLTPLSVTPEAWAAFTPHPPSPGSTRAGSPPVSGSPPGRGSAATPRRPAAH